MLIPFTATAEPRLMAPMSIRPRPAANVTVASNVVNTPLAGPPSGLLPRWYVIPMARCCEFAEPAKAAPTMRTTDSRVTLVTPCRRARSSGREAADEPPVRGQADDDDGCYAQGRQMQAFERVQRASGG